MRRSGTPSKIAPDCASVSEKSFCNPRRGLQRTIIRSSRGNAGWLLSPIQLSSTPPLRFSRAPDSLSIGIKPMPTGPGSRPMLLALAIAPAAVEAIPGGAAGNSGSSGKFDTTGMIVSGGSCTATTLSGCLQVWRVRMFYTVYCDTVYYTVLRNEQLGSTSSVCIMCLTCDLGSGSL